MSFDQLGLAPELLRAVEAEGYTTPTPVQAEAIPLVLQRRDVLAGAQTGTGKTAAFVLPILQILHATRPEPRQLPPGNQRPKGATGLPIRVLVLTPTRELALQVEESVRTYGRNRPVRSTAIFGGVGYENQVRALRGGPEVVVATPGRLLDHLGQNTIDLSHVEILVLDEADRMLDMGFIRDIRRVLAVLPPKRQNLLFSATFSDEIRELASGLLHDPAFVQIARRNAPIELVRQVVIPVDRDRKRELLAQLIKTGRIDQALVFTRTKHGANRLAEQLVRDGISANAIHGNKSQGQRVRALDDFKAGRVPILVATEVAARGLDIEGLPHVVNFELPMVPEDYVHRIGRTGRAGLAGDAVSLVCVDEAPLLRDIERLLRTNIPEEVVPGFAPDRSIRPEPIRLRSVGGRPAPSRPTSGRPPMNRAGMSRPTPGRPTAGRPDPSRTHGRPNAAGGERVDGRPQAANASGGQRPTNRPDGRSQGTPRPDGRGPWRGDERGRPQAAGNAGGASFGNRAVSHHGASFGNRGRNSGRSGPHRGQGGPAQNTQHGQRTEAGFRPLPGERIARSGERALNS